MTEKLIERLKELRAKHNISQAQLAVQIGVEPSFIGMVETGKSSISIQTLILLADYFGVSTDYILGRTESQVNAI